MYRCEEFLRWKTQRRDCVDLTTRPTLGLLIHDNLPTLNASPCAEAAPVQITMDAKIAPRIRIAVILQTST
jgi:hypothetical protein